MRSRLLEPLARSLRSLRNRLALLIFAVTLLAIGTLYTYVAPGLEDRVVNQRLQELAIDARSYSKQIATTVGSSDSRAQIGDYVDYAGLQSGARVSLLSVSYAMTPSGPQLTNVADSSNPSSASALSYPIAQRAISTGALARGTEQTSSGAVAEAALPVRYHGEIARVIVYSDPVADIVRSVETVRHQILIAGAIALLLALVGGYATARWLAARVKRLERAADRVAAGEFGRPIPIDSRDELGQLAAAFNQMQRQLQQLDRARKQFIATASHELRTPVFSLGGFVELLEDEELDADTRRRFLGHVSAQVERLRKLSVDLLDLSRMESGALELRPEQVDVAELTRSVSAEFEVALAARDAELALRALPGTEAQCDPVRLAQIVRILIDNALAHNPSGTHIVLTAARENGTLRLAVLDDGAGIDPAVQSRIFEPFFTADDAQGSGLGLAIASELAERMDGRLTVASSPGRTVFELQLPGG